MAKNNDPPDLDDLLDSALDDLEDLEKEEKNRPKPAEPAPVQPIVTNSGGQLKAASQPAQNVNNNNNSKHTEDMLSEQFVHEMRRIMDDFNKGDIESTMKEIEKMAQAMGVPLDDNGQQILPPSSPSSDPSSQTTPLPSTTATSSSTPSTASNSSFEENMVNTLKMLAENAKNIENNPGDELDSAAMDKLMEGFENNSEFQSLMDGMIQQLISKDILYDAMKELREKYPGYLKENETKLAEEDYRRYIKQYECVQRICTLYETNNEPSQEIIVLMQEMAECGQPPKEIISELAPGVQFGADGMPLLPGGDGNPAQQGCSIM